MRRALVLSLAAVFFLACEDSTPQGKKTSSDDDGGGGGGGAPPTGGSSGDVAIGGASDGTIADRYEKALKMIKDKDWDGARDQLLEAYRRSDSNDVKKEIRGHLAMVEQGILAQPAYSTPEVFGASSKLLEKRVSMRGAVIQGGAVAKVTYYFWLNAGGKIQCRFQDLTLDEKKTILSLPDGSQVLVRGTLKPAWGSNPNPYLDLTYFRLEKRAPEPAKEASPESAAP